MDKAEFEVKMAPLYEKWKQIPFWAQCMDCGWWIKSNYRDVTNFWIDVAYCPGCGKKGYINGSGQPFGDME